MKIRMGFVSNSSSSDYVCPLCIGHLYAAYGGDLDIDEGDIPDYAYCPTCEQPMHLDCIKGWLCEKEEKKCIEQIRANFYRDGEGDPVFDDQSLCPICSMKYISPEDVLEYLSKKLSIDIASIKEEMRGKK